MLVVSLFTTFVFEQSVFAEKARPAPGSIKFGAAENPNAERAEKLGAFKTIFADIAEASIPSVVSVIPTKIDTVIFQRNPFYNYFGDEQFADPFEFFFGRPRQQAPRRQQQPQIEKKERRQQGMGSGVIVSKDGYILTNFHVVSGADEIEVKLNDGRTFRAETIGNDSLTDVAVLKITEKVNDLPVAAIGDSDKLRPGDWVIAIGNPFSLTSTVTTGIVSALGRNVSGNEQYQSFIQTDAAINPGNSGGALLNIDGELVGINTMIYSRSGGYMGIGFAIPINMAKKVMEDLIYKGTVERGWIGVSIQDLDQNVRSALNLGSLNGVLVADVVKGAAAEKAGVKRGDIITSIDGKDVKSANDLRNLVAAISPDKKVVLKVFRDGKAVSMDIVVGRRGKQDAASTEEKSETASGKNESFSKKLGFKAAKLTPEVRRQYRIDESVKGVVVTEVVSGDLPLNEGDVILELKTRQGDFVTIETIEQLEQATKGLKTGDSVVFLINRNNNNFFTGFKVSK
ncbi:MAG: Do family serine endopeptidase [Fibrobacter sp.]|nr:Do family serine endopeptidase [Fibrobacter sp.]